MSKNYGNIKTMKAAAIGTIIPWTGGTTEIPKGWLECDGSSISAVKYPLLAQAIGNTYGGTTFSGNFPNYSGNIVLPRITTRPLVDLDVGYFGSGATSSGNVATGKNKREQIDTLDALSQINKFIGDGSGALGTISTVVPVTGTTFSVTPPSGIPFSSTGTDVAPISMVGTSTNRYERSGALNQNPAVSWEFNTSKFPGGVNIASYTLLLESLSETVNGKNLVLWHLTGIPSTIKSISANASSLPAGITIRSNYLGLPGQGIDGISNVGYSGPQPPNLTAHTYRLTVSAVLSGPTVSILTEAVQFRYPVPSANDQLDESLNTPTYPYNRNIVLGNTGSVAAASDIDRGPSLSYDVSTDILFTYEVDSEFTGTITGAKLDGGFGTSQIYVAPRKLGRKHLQPHTHSGSFASMQGVGSDKPGSGVSCSREVTYEFKSAAYDEGVYILGILISSTPQTDVSRSQPNDGSSAFGDGVDGVVLANINTETSNYKPQSVHSHGISRWLGKDPSISQPFKIPSNSAGHDPEINLKDSVPYGIGGRVYLENRNYDPGDGGSGDTHSPYKVSFNTSAIDLTAINNIPGSTTVVEAHDHGSFEINYTNGNLRMPAVINVQPGDGTTGGVVADIEVNNLPGALNINATVTTPNLTIMYLIRAY